MECVVCLTKCRKIHASCTTCTATYHKKCIKEALKTAHVSNSNKCLVCRQITFQAYAPKQKKLAYKSLNIISRVESIIEDLVNFHRSMEEDYNIAAIDISRILIDSDEIGFMNEVMNTIVQDLV